MTAKLLWVITFDPVMKNVFTNGSFLHQGDSDPTCIARGVTEWFNEYENDANPVPSQCPVLQDVNPSESS